MAEPIAFSLRARGHKVFLDRDDLPPGGEYDMRIERAVERSDLFVFLVSPAAIEKGRFTLTELEFARRKWRKADGHVLPVMVQPTPIADIPTFLKSVTILEPKGNAAAEVAAAVGPLAQRAAGGQMLVFGGLGLISGFFTWRLKDVFKTVLEPRGLDVSINYVNLSLELAGLAFAAALACGFAYFLRFQPRQMVIIPFVLAGWFLAMQAVISFAPPTPIRPEAQQDKPCPDSDETVECLRLALFRYKEKEKTQKDSAVWATAGAVGAMITALGVPIATRRIFSISAVSTTTLAGAGVTVVWFAILSWTTPESADGSFTFLFMAWQPIVAAVIGRSIK